MKKLTLLAMLLCAVGASARPYRGVGNGDYHFGYISASAGYSSLSQDIPNVTTRGNLAEIFGAGYEFRMNSAWVSIGLQYTRLQSTTTPDQYVYQTPIGGFDNQLKVGQGPERVAHYLYTIRQKDRQYWNSIDIPLMAGYYNSGFYVGAGLKVGFSVGSYIKTGGDYDLAAQYERYVGTFENINMYTNYPAPEQRYDCKLRPQFALLGEIGYDLLSSLQSNSKICHMLNIGFYCEYGLRSVRPNDSLDPIQVQGMNIMDAARVEGDVCNAHMTPYYLSSMTEGRRVAPFYVGIKLTYLIGGSWSSTGTWHKGCQCYGN